MERGKPTSTDWGFCLDFFLFLLGWTGKTKSRKPTFFKSPAFLKCCTFLCLQDQAPAQANHKRAWYDLQNYFSGYLGERWLISMTAPESTHWCYPNPCAQGLALTHTLGQLGQAPLLPCSTGLCWAVLGRHKAGTRAFLRVLGIWTTPRIYSPPEPGQGAHLPCTLNLPWIWSAWRLE